MANVMLVSYAGYPYTPSSLCPDNGLARLAAVLQGAGHEVRIVDFGVVDTMRRMYPEELSQQAAPLLAELSQCRGAPSPALLQELANLDAALEQHQERETRGIAQDVAREVADLEPAFVGFKLWNGDGFTGSVTIAEALRERHPKLKLFAGGPHATWFAPIIFERTKAFDAIAVGEAERTILDLAANAVNGQSLQDVPGLVLSAASPATPTSSVPLDDLPLPAYDETTYPAMAGDQKLKLFVLDDSRGCPYCCAFCTHPFESGRRLRTRSAPRIVDEMAAIIDHHGIRAFRFAGSSTPGSLMAEVADEIISRKLDVAYTTFGHFASSAPAHFEKMRQSGLQAMFFGLETGSPDLLARAAGKPIKLQAVKEAVEAAKAAGIATVCSMIVPMPFETEDTLAESVALILDLRPDSVPVQFAGLLPGTPWFLEPEEYAFEVDKEQYVRENLGYKIKLLFPPTFWKPLPYKLNGLTFGEFVKITGEFVATLEANGVLTNMPDDNLLMAALVGMTPRAFRDRARAWCAAGDVPAMGDFVARFNAAARSPNQ